MPPREPVPGPPRTVVREVPPDPLDGIRGWLAELDRSLRVRTAVGLFLVAACIGAAAAAIYMALDSDDDDNAARRGSVERLNERVEGLDIRLTQAREEAEEARDAARASQAEARETRAEIASLASTLAELGAEGLPGTDRLPDSPGRGPGSGSGSGD